MSKKPVSKTSGSTSKIKAQKILKPQIMVFPLVGLIIEVLAIYVSLVISNNFNANPNNNACQMHPNYLPTISIALIGLVIAIIGIQKAFQLKHRVFEAITILLGLACLVLAIAAFIAVWLQICF